MLKLLKRMGNMKEGISPVSIRFPVFGSIPVICSPVVLLTSPAAFSVDPRIFSRGLEGMASAILVLTSEDAETACFFISARFCSLTSTRDSEEGCTPVTASSTAASILSWEFGTFALDRSVLRLTTTKSTKTPVADKIPKRFDQAIACQERKKHEVRLNLKKTFLWNKALYADSTDLLNVLIQHRRPFRHIAPPSPSNLKKIKMTDWDLILLMHKLNKARAARIYVTREECIAAKSLPWSI